MRRIYFYNLMLEINNNMKETLHWAQKLTETCRIMMKIDENSTFLQWNWSWVKNRDGSSPLRHVPRLQSKSCPTNKGWSTLKPHLKSKCRRLTLCFTWWTSIIRIWVPGNYISTWPKIKRPSFPPMNARVWCGWKCGWEFTSSPKHYFPPKIDISDQNS